MPDIVERHSMAMCPLVKNGRMYRMDGFYPTANSKKGDDQRLNPLYPLYASGLVDRFPGPERQTLRPLPVPFDHGEVGEPLGLRVLGEGRGWQHAHNHLRHTCDHDGFIVWVAEYRLQDDSTRITWEELPMEVIVRRSVRACRLSTARIPPRTC